MLYVMFACAVRVQGVDRMVLRDRQCLRLAVDGAARGCIDDLSHSESSATFQNVHRSKDIDIRIKQRLRHGLPHIGPRRLMARYLRAFLLEEAIPILTAFARRDRSNSPTPGNRSAGVICWIIST